VQGPLGLSAAFEAQEAGLHANMQSKEKDNDLLSTFKLLEILGIGGSQRETPKSNDNGSKLGGEYSAVGPGGASTSNWFISPGE